VNEWKAKPAMIGWNVADDFNVPYAGPSYDHPPAEVAARSATIAALAPNHLSYASGGSYPGFRIAEFAGTMQLMGFQSYPIGAENHPDDYALQENAESFQWVRDQLAGTGQVFVANPQAYRWAGHRYPTPREARNLLYAPLVYGAKGIVWYTMWEGNGTLLPSVVPGLWGELGRLNAEMHGLAAFFLHGARSELATGSTRVHAASWVHDGQVLVVALSSERTVAHALSLALPPTATAPAHARFPTRTESGFTVGAGTLDGTIGPEEVHVYLLDLPVAGDAAPSAAFDVVPARNDTVAFGEPATLEASASSDDDGTVVDWQWDFGDGTLASGVSVAHTWTQPGTYAVRLTVRDDDGAPATVVTPVAVGVTSLCPPTPRAGCRAAGASTLTLRHSPVASKRRLDFAWKKAEAVLAELGNPTSITEVALCVYDANGLVLATSQRAGTVWQSAGTKGFRLKNASGTPGGLVKGTLKPGSSATLLLKGKEARLPPFGLPLVLPVTAQLATSDGGTCWQGVYAPGSKTTSTGTTFKGRQG
jgi:PKD repeat protein